MEIKTTMTTCPNGHHYDAAQHASCPYCGASGRAAAGPRGAFPSTEAPSSAGLFPPTEAPGSAGMFPPTETPASPAKNYVANPNPFSVETVIGCDPASGNSNTVEPVVGWLVCTEGPARGVDFRIHAGYNYIGREVGDIHLSGDPQVSRQNHAMIAFDDSDKTYFVGPSAGRNLIKVNGKTVLNAVEIKSYDVISIGATKLIFVPLCGEQFSWDPKEAANG